MRREKISNETTGGKKMVEEEVGERFEDGRGCLANFNTFLPVPLANTRPSAFEYRGQLRLPSLVRFT